MRGRDREIRLGLEEREGCVIEYRRVLFLEEIARPLYRGVKGEGREGSKVLLFFFCFFIL